MHLPLFKHLSIAVAAAVAGLTLNATAIAQIVLTDDYDGGIPSEEPNYDGGGVDLVSGTLEVRSPGVSIGTAEAGGLSFHRTFRAGQWRFSVMGGVASVPSSSDVIVFVGDGAERFTYTLGSYAPEAPSGSTLTESSGVWTYTVSNGTEVEFRDSLLNTAWTPQVYGADRALISKITAPNGLETTYGYHQTQYLTYFPGTSTPSTQTAFRLDSVRTNTGYQLHFGYDSNVTAGIDNFGSFYDLDKVTALNNTIDVCSVGAACSGLSQAWPTISVSGPSTGPGTYIYTDALGHATEVVIDANDRVASLQTPEASTPNISYTYHGDGRVASIVRGTLTTSYGYVDNPPFARETTVTRPGGSSSVITSSLVTGLIVSVEDSLSNTTSYYYDAHDRLDRMVMPEGQEIHYSYDSRGNVTQERRIATAASGLADLVTSAAYPASCTNPVTCNLPTSTTDTAGNVTSYTYDAIHGGIRTITAPSVGGDQPRTEIFYETRQASYKLSQGGSLVAADPIHVPVRASQCRTGAAGACYGTATERRTTLDYGLQNNTANNLHMRSQTVALGDGTLPRTVSYTFNAMGDVEIVDGPVAGTVDRIHSRYDLLRRQIGVIGPDPDGAGPLQRAAQRFTFDGDGRMTTSEAGTTNGTDDTAWAAFVRTQRQVADYDVIGRVTEARAYAAGTTIEAAIQHTYGTNGQVECSVVRMNPAVYSSLPASACALGTAGTQGPDRITRYTYDANGRVRTTTEGYGTSAQGIASTVYYTPNGAINDINDGNSNRTRYLYDGHGRRYNTAYANAIGGGTNWSDYERYTFDSAGRVATRRVRTSEIFSYTYDALGRITNATAPSGTASTSFTYDNFNHPLTVSDGTNTITNTYNAMGELLSQAQAHGTVSYQYDSAGRRSRMTWPDAFYVEYDWNDVSQLTAIRENGATSGLGVLASFEYDTQGRRTRLLRGNGTETRYDYDPLGRLDEFVTDLAGTANDNTDTFTFNPAGQIASRTRTNTAYSYASHINVDTMFGHNGLNQTTMTANAATSGAPGTPVFTDITRPTYDGRGNLTSDGTRSYTYDSYNRLTSATVTAGTVNLDYDPVGRLDTVVTTGGTSVGFIWDGWNQIGYDIGGSITWRFIHGPGTNEVLVQHSGAGRRWLHADVRGSIIAHTDETGALTQTNTYDEYGNRGPGNSGPIQYTGHLWLGEIEVYYAKNRMYDPRLMRFLTTDPIGVTGGINLYAYVGGDPVNFTDPLGLKKDTITITAPRIDPCERIGVICDRDEINDFLRGLAERALYNLGEQLHSAADQIGDEVARQIVDRVCQAAGDLMSALLSGGVPTVSGTQTIIAEVGAEVTVGAGVSMQFGGWLQPSSGRWGAIATGGGNAGLDVDIGTVEVTIADSIPSSGWGLNAGGGALGFELNYSAAIDSNGDISGQGFGGTYGNSALPNWGSFLRALNRLKAGASGGVSQSGVVECTAP